MVDIALTKRGDLAIQNILEYKDRLEINFTTSKNSAVNINFFIEDTFKKEKKPDSLSINFFIKKQVENQDVRILTDNEAIEQVIKIRLLTSLGSIRQNTDIGSKIEMVIHNNIDDKSTETSLIKYIREALSDLLPNPSVTIKKTSTNYLDYSNGFTVMIEDNNNVYQITL